MFRLTARQTAPNGVEWITGDVESFVIHHLHHPLQCPLKLDNFYEFSFGIDYYRRVFFGMPHAASEIDCHFTFDKWQMLRSISHWIFMADGACNSHCGWKMKSKKWKMHDKIATLIVSEVIIEQSKRWLHSLWMWSCSKHSPSQNRKLLCESIALDSLDLYSKLGLCCCWLPRKNNNIVFN